MLYERRPDVLFVHADSSVLSYQGLSARFAAIEPPTWCLLLAQSCRSVGFGAMILDCAAEGLDIDEAVERICEIRPRLVCFVVYGQNPNSGTTNMSGATLLCRRLKEVSNGAKTCFVGSHTNALPNEVLGLDYVDFVLLNEGVYALRNLLKTDLENYLDKVRGIGFKKYGRNILNEPEYVVPQERMDIDLPGYAWDLLPYKSKPLDLYRSHFWHADFDHTKRTPFAAIYTSLGCRFRCEFCMINILNRMDNRLHITAADSPQMRFWSPDFIIREFEKLAGMGVETIRISDEMFFLDKRYYKPLVEMLEERDLGLRLWAYARVDTVRSEYLKHFKNAGINWLAIGVESANKQVRHEVSKGSFKDTNIYDVINMIRDADINVISNFIFGLPEDTIQTMRETLDLALELNTEMANMYPCIALPGSRLYHTAKKRHWALPESYEGYGFLSYECQPLPTKYVSAKEVLSIRDKAWNEYFNNPAYLELVERKFGVKQRRNVEEMKKIRLRRKILGDVPLKCEAE